MKIIKGLTPRIIPIPCTRCEGIPAAVGDVGQTVECWRCVAVGQVKVCEEENTVLYVKIRCLDCKHTWWSNHRMALPHILSERGRPVRKVKAKHSNKAAKPYIEPSPVRQRNERLGRAYFGLACFTYFKSCYYSITYHSIQDYIDTQTAISNAEIDIAAFFAKKGTLKGTPIPGVNWEAKKLLHIILEHNSTKENRNT